MAAVKMDVTKIASEQKHTKKFVVEYLKNYNLVIKTDWNNCPAIFLKHKEHTWLNDERVASISSSKQEKYRVTMITINNNQYYINAVCSSQDVYNSSTSLFKILTPAATKFVDAFIEQCVELLIEDFKSDSDGENDTTFVFTVKE